MCLSSEYAKRKRTVTYRTLVCLYDNKKVRVVVFVFFLRESIWVKLKVNDEKKRGTVVLRNFS